MSRRWWRRSSPSPGGAGPTSRRPRFPGCTGWRADCLANAVRGYGRRRRLLDRIGNDESAHGRQVVDSPDAASPGDWVHEALARLSPADQEVLRLTAWEELGVDEVARGLGCGTRAAAMRLHRAHHQLRAIDRMHITVAGGPDSPRRDTPKDTAMADELDILRRADQYRRPPTSTTAPSTSTRSAVSTNCCTANGAAARAAAPLGLERRHRGRRRCRRPDAPRCRDRPPPRPWPHRPLIVEAGSTPTAGPARRPSDRVRRLAAARPGHPRTDLEHEPDLRRDRPPITLPAERVVPLEGRRAVVPELVVATDPSSGQAGRRRRRPGPRTVEDGRVLAGGPCRRAGATPRGSPAAARRRAAARLPRRDRPHRGHGYIRTSRRRSRVAGQLDAGRP